MIDLGEPRCRRCFTWGAICAAIVALLIALPGCGGDCTVITPAHVKCPERPASGAG